MNALQHQAGPAPAYGTTEQVARPFWQRRTLWWILAAISLVPFLGTTILPFNDLPNHVGRHYVFLNIASDPFLHRFYSVHWTLAGNLGVDIIVRAIGQWLGAEIATNLVVALIPPLTIFGIYSLSRSFHGQIAPSALLAVPLAFNWPLITGFTNFCLSAALALLALALWMRIRASPYGWRVALFCPIVFCAWLAHTAGWGLLGLGIAAFEFARATERGISLKRLVSTAFQLLPFLPTILFVVLWRQKASNGAAISVGQDFWRNKVISIASLFREHYAVWDIFSLIFFGVATVLFFMRGGRKFAWTPAVIASAYLVAFAVCPQEVFKSGFADRRLLTYAALMVPLAIGWTPSRQVSSNAARSIRILVAVCIGFFVTRVAVSTVVWRDASRLQEARLTLVSQVPIHSRIFRLVVEPCNQTWNRVGRPDHIQQYALLRRDSMVNGMFQNPGLNQVDAKFNDDIAAFNPNMLAVVHDESCPVPYIKQTLQTALSALPRDLFDYLWIISDQGFSPFAEGGLTLVATRGNDRLYQITGSLRDKSQ